MVDGNGGGGFADWLSHYSIYLFVGLWLIISKAFHKLAEWLSDSESKKQKSRTLEFEAAIKSKFKVKFTYKSKQS